MFVVAQFSLISPRIYIHNNLPNFHKSESMKINPKNLLKQCTNIGFPDFKKFHLNKLCTGTTFTWYIYNLCTIVHVLE